MEANLKINHKLKDQKLFDSQTLATSGHLVFKIPTRAPIDEKLQNDVFPFLNLNVKNYSELNKIGNSFLHDVGLERKHFGFTSFTANSTDREMLAIGSFINFVSKKPVLLFVDNLQDPFWDVYRHQFNQVSLLKWNCSLWGKICLIDFNELTKPSANLHDFSFNFINNEFEAVLWSLPAKNLKSLFKNALQVMGNISSITISVESGKTSFKEIEKVLKELECFGIKLKGILTESAFK